MPTNEVKVLFTADDTALAATVKKLEAGLEQLGHTPTGDRINQQFEKAAEGVNKAGKAAQDAGEKTKALGKSGQDAGEGFSKLGEHTKKAHEHLELFGKAGDRVKEQFKDIQGHIVNLGLSFVGLTGAWEIITHAFEAGRAFAAARGGFRNVIGDTEEAREAFESLEKTSRQTGISIEELVNAAKGMYAAGDAVGDIASQMENLAKVSVVTGTDIGELSDLLDRMKTHGDVTFREIFRLTQATGGATREMAAQFRDLPRVLDAATKSLDAVAKIQEVAFKEAEKHRDALEGLAKKGGLAEQVFKDFSQELNRFGGRGLGQMDFSTMLDVRKFGPWGEKAARELWGSFNLGIQQLSHESGASVNSIIAMVRGGLYSMDELLAAAKARREAIAEHARAAIEYQKEMIAANVQQQQFQILDNIRDKLEQGVGIQEKFNRSIQGFGRELAIMANQVEEAFARVGLSWTGALKPALDALSHGDVFGAFQKLPGWIQDCTIAWGAFEGVITAGKILEALGAIKAAIIGIKAAEVEATVAAEALTAAQAGAAGEAIGGSIIARLLAGAGPLGIALAAAFGAKVLLDFTSRDPGRQAEADAAQKRADEAQAREAERQQIEAKHEGGGMSDEEYRRAIGAIGREYKLPSEIAGIGEHPLAEKTPEQKQRDVAEEQAKKQREEAEAATRKQEAETRVAAEAEEVKAKLPKIANPEAMAFLEKYANLVAAQREAMRQSDIAKQGEIGRKLGLMGAQAPLVEWGLAPEMKTAMSEAINMLTVNMTDATHPIVGAADTYKDAGKTQDDAANTFAKAVDKFQATKPPETKPGDKGGGAGAGGGGGGEISPEGQRNLLQRKLFEWSRQPHVGGELHPWDPGGFMYEGTKKLDQAAAERRAAEAGGGGGVPPVASGGGGGAETGSTAMTGYPLGPPATSDTGEGAYQAQPGASDYWGAGGGVMYPTYRNPPNISTLFGVKDRTPEEIEWVKQAQAGKMSAAELAKRIKGVMDEREKGMLEGTPSPEKIEDIKKGPYMWRMAAPGEDTSKWPERQRGFPPWFESGDKNPPGTELPSPFIQGKGPGPDYSKRGELGEPERGGGQGMYPVKPPSALAAPAGAAAEKAEPVAPKIDKSNELLAKIEAAIAKALTAGGAT
jgi:hypothetical protein